VARRSGTGADLHYRFRRVAAAPVIMAASLSGSTWSAAEALWNPGLTLGTTSCRAIRDRRRSPRGNRGQWLRAAGCGSSTRSMGRTRWQYGMRASRPLRRRSNRSSSPLDRGCRLEQACPDHRCTLDWAPALALITEWCRWRSRRERQRYLVCAVHRRQGLGDHAKLPGFATATGLALAMGDTGNLHMVWVGPPAALCIQLIFRDDELVFQFARHRLVGRGAAAGYRDWIATVCGHPILLVDRGDAGVDGVSGTSHDVYVLPMTAYATVGRRSLASEAAPTSSSPTTTRR